MTNKTPERVERMEKERKSQCIFVGPRSDGEKKVVNVVELAHFIEETLKNARLFKVVAIVSAISIMFGHWNIWLTQKRNALAAMSSKSNEVQHFCAYFILRGERTKKKLQSRKMSTDIFKCRSKQKTEDSSSHNDWPVNECKQQRTTQTAQTQQTNTE